MLRKILYKLFPPPEIKKAISYVSDFIDKNDFDNDVKEAFKQQTIKIINDDAIDVVYFSRKTSIEIVALLKIIKAIDLTLNKFKYEISNKDYSLFFMFLTELWTFSHNKLAMLGFMTIKQANEQNNRIIEFLGWKEEFNQTGNS